MLCALTTPGIEAREGIHIQSTWPVLRAVVFLTPDLLLVIVPQKHCRKWLALTLCAGPLLYTLPEGLYANGTFFFTTVSSDFVSVVRDPVQAKSPSLPELCREFGTSA